MLSISRLVVVLQLLWIASVSIKLVPLGGRRLSSLQYFLLLTIAFTLNVGTWPLMPWHTIDGLFIGMTALWLTLCRTDSRLLDNAQWSAVWLLAGFAPLTKQGFALVPILVAGVLWANGPRRAWRYSPLVVLPGALYAFWTGSAFVGQLYSGSSAELLVPLSSVFEIAGSPTGMITLLAVASAFLLVSKVPGSRLANRWIGGLLIALPVIWTANREAMGLSSSSAYLSVIVLTLVAVLTVRCLRTASVIVALLGLGFAASMSWGVPGPGLLSGSYLATSLFLFWGRGIDEFSSETNGFRSGFTVLIGVVLLASLFTMVFSRQASTYSELPRAGLTKTVPDRQFELIKMSPQSAAYLESLQRCLDRYPASLVAVLPDNPGLYPLLRLRNPFSVDWWLPPERTFDHNEKVDKTVQVMNGEDDWLVLFQSYEVYALRDLSLEQVTARGEPIAHDRNDLSLLKRLKGREVKCDSFTGQYKQSSD